MDIDSWLRQAKKEIAPLDAELIAMRVFAPSCDRSWLVAHGEQEIPERLKNQADKMVTRRKEGMPLAYLVQEKEFYGRKFWVRPGVLIPRPETEALIETVKALDLPKQPSFLEIGTGSGCIAITLALEFPQSYVVASDISVRALETAEYNDVQHEGRVELVESNLLRDFEFEETPEHFDVLVANLPYVNKDWDWLDRHNLSFEPASALYARGNNGLSTYQRFLRELYHFRDRGDLQVDYVVLEADPCQHAALIKMAERAALVHLATNGYALLFEDRWRYWWDYREQKYVRKPKEVLEYERDTGDMTFIPDEYYERGE